MPVITNNAISQIAANGSDNSSGFQPILQVLDVKKLQTNATQPPRYRLTLSDGAQSIVAMVGTQNNESIANGSVAVNTLIRLGEYTFNNVQNQPIIILLRFDILGTADPVPTANAAPARPAQAPPTAPHYGAAASPYGGFSAAPPAAPASIPSPYGAGAYGGSAISNRPVVRDDHGGDSVLPIASLNPYSNKWTIKARVTNKSDIRRWSNAKGEGQLFSVDLLDADGGEIRGTFFKEMCEKWFPIIEVQKVYTFSNGQIKMADRKFSSLKNNYEVTFNNYSEIRLVAGDNDSIKHVQYHFTKIAHLNDAAVNSNVDILCVVKAGSECSEINSQKQGGKILHKRDLTVFDDSGCECRLTLWGDRAREEVNWSADQPILAIKSARVGEYNGKNLSLGAGSSLEINPDIPEAHTLYRFKISNGAAALTSLSTAGPMGSGSGADALERRKEIAAIKDESMGLGEKPDYITVKATVNHIKHDTDCWYTACPTEGCNKKVHETLNNNWSCEKCMKEFPQCNRRYIMSIQMTDASGQSWFSLFNDTAEALLGRTAEEMYQLKCAGSVAEEESVYNNAKFKQFIVKVRVKQESVNDEMRVKASVMNLTPVNFVSESKLLIEAIRKYDAK